MKPSILEKLQQLSDRLEEVTHLLGQPEATSDMDNYRKLTREHAELTPVVEVFQNYQLAQSDLADAEEMLSDPEMKDFAAEEIEAAKTKIDELDTELQNSCCPKMPTTIKISLSKYARYRRRRSRAVCRRFAAYVQPLRRAQPLAG